MPETTLPNSTPQPLPTPLLSSLPSSPRYSLLQEIELLLRNRPKFFTELMDGQENARKIRAMMLYSAAFFAVYGAVMGVDHSLAQMLSSAIKLPFLFLITLIITLPTLFFFNTFFEASLTLSQNLALILSAITMTSIVLLAFAPVVVFFLISTSQYQFFKLLNVSIFIVAGLIGIRQLTLGMKMLTMTDRVGVTIRRRLLFLWMLLYGFVGSQMAWGLRPFFGAPGLPFELFRGFGGNFYTNVLASLGEILGFFIVR